MIPCNKSTCVILFHLYYSTSVASITSGCFITRISSRPTRVFFSNSRPHTASLLEAQSCASKAFNEGGFSLLLTLCSHNKTVNCKDNAEPCIRHQQGIQLPSPQTGDLGCHSVTVPLSHTSHRALHPVKTWHGFAQRTVRTLYECVCAHVYVCEAHA